MDWNQPSVKEHKINLIFVFSEESQLSVTWFIYPCFTNMPPFPAPIFDFGKELSFFFMRVSHKTLISVVYPVHDTGQTWTGESTLI